MAARGGAGEAAEEARPGDLPHVGQRAREEQGTEADADACHGGAQGARLEGGCAPPALEEDHEDDGGHHGEQEPGLLEERVVGALEIDGEVRAGQCARQQRRQKGANAAGDGQPDALSDGESEVHGALA